jgi:hypothetical protein
LRVFERNDPRPLPAREDESGQHVGTLGNVIGGCGTHDPILQDSSDF